MYDGSKHVKYYKFLDHFIMFARYSHKNEKWYVFYKVEEQLKCGNLGFFPIM